MWHNKTILRFIFIISVCLTALAAGCNTYDPKAYPGGYKESHTDYKKERADELQQKKKPGYYDGAYHNQSPDFKPNDEQFVDPGKNIKKEAGQ